MTDLITLAEYKTLVGMTSEKEDATLTALIGSVSSLVRAYCNTSFTDFATIAKVQTFNIPNQITRTLFLKETPLIEMVSVMERESYTSDYTILTSEDYYYNEDLEAIVRMYGGVQKSWSVGPAAVVATYKAGYADLPEDLKLAVVAMVTYYFKEQYKESSQNIGSTSIINNVPTKLDMPGHIKRVLSLYRNIL